MKSKRPKHDSDESLLADAFLALIEKLGPERGMRAWRVLTASRSDYLPLRRELFVGKDVDKIYQGARQFNRQS